MEGILSQINEASQVTYKPMSMDDLRDVVDRLQASKQPEQFVVFSSPRLQRRRLYIIERHEFFRKTLDVNWLVEDADLSSADFSNYCRKHKLTKDDINILKAMIEEERDELKEMDQCKPVDIPNLEVTDSANKYMDLIWI